MKHKDNIKIALETFDINNAKFNKILKKIGGVYISQSWHDNEKNTLNFELVDKDKKVLFRFDVEIISAYYPKPNLWVWAWNIPTLKSYMFSKSKQMLLYGLELNETDNIDLKIELVNPRYVITNPIQKDIHVALVSYLTKSPFIIKIGQVCTEKINNIEYFLINNDSEYQNYIIILNHKEFLEKFGTD